MATIIVSNIKNICSLSSRTVRLSLPAVTVLPIRGAKKYLIWPNNWLPFEWETPEPEIGYFVSGDPKEKLEDVPEKFRAGFEFLEHDKNVPDDVKKIFSLGFARRSETLKYKTSQQVKRFQRTPLDDMSHEARIARYTVSIRSLQENIREFHPNDALSKCILNKMIGKRHKFLNELSCQSRPRYDAIVKALNIDHTPTEPGIVEKLPIHRKPTLRKLTTEYCDTMKREKLDAYKEKLKSQQEGFLKEKEATLNWINQEKARYQINEEDIKKAKLLKTGFSAWVEGVAPDTLIK